MTKINEDEAAYYLKVFRQARYAALEDAENFREACFALEEFGCYLNGENTKSLRKYSTVLRNFVKSKRKQEFSILFDLVVEARNEAAHRGVFARNLSGKSVRLSLILEETLSDMAIKVKHLMTEGVIFAEEFSTLAKIREMMLENSFSYIPVKFSEGYYLISDSIVSKKWQELKNDDKKRYNTKISKIFSTKDLIPADGVLSEESKTIAYLKIRHLPLLVFDGTHENRKVVGILTPFDLL